MKPYDESKSLLTTSGKAKVPQNAAEVVELCLCILRMLPTWRPRSADHPARNTAEHLGRLIGRGAANEAQAGVWRRVVYSLLDDARQRQQLNIPWEHGFERGILEGRKNE